MQWIKETLLPNSVRGPLRRAANRAVGVVPERVREYIPEAIRVHNTKRTERDFWRMVAELSKKVKVNNNYEETVIYKPYGEEEREMSIFDVAKEVSFRMEREPLMDAFGNETKIAEYLQFKTKEAGVSHELYKTYLNRGEINMFQSVDDILYQFQNVLGILIYGIRGIQPDIREEIQSLEEIKANVQYRQIYERRAIEALLDTEQTHHAYIEGQLRPYYVGYIYPANYKLTADQKRDRLNMIANILNEGENNGGWNNDPEPNPNLAVLMSQSIGNITPQLVEGLPIRGTLSIVNPGDDIMGDEYVTGDIVIVIKKMQGQQIVNIPLGEIKPIHIAKVETVVALLEYQKTADEELGREFSKKFKHPFEQGRFVKDMNELVKYILDIPRAATLAARREEKAAAQKSQNVEASRTQGVIRRQGRAGSVVRGGKRKMRKTRKHKTRGRK